VPPDASTTITPPADEAEPTPTTTTPTPTKPTTRSAAAKPTTARQRAHRAAVGKRAPLVKVHRWVSFVVLAWVVLESLTGTVLVYHDAIDRQFSGDTFTSTPGDVGPAAAIASARKARPDDFVRSIVTPADEDSGGMYRVYVTDADAEYHQVVVDPGSGKVTNDDYHLNGALDLIERLHVDLNSTSIFGFAPLTIMGVLSLAWLAVVLSGFYLWYWPGVKRWARAVRVRRSRGRFTFHLDLHKAVGFLSIVPITLIILTGLNFAFPKQVGDVWHVVSLGTYDRESSAKVATSTTQPGAKPIDATEARDIVAELDPNLRIIAVVTPGGSPVGVWEVQADADPAAFGMVGGERVVEFSVDQYSGRIVSIEDPRDKNAATTAMEDWSYRVHFGTFAATPGRLLWLLVGISPVVLGVTGTVMWFSRRNKRRARLDRSTTDDDPPPTATDPADVGATTDATESDSTEPAATSGALA
jgi:uncharacterized iron-regulated membrane protein